MAEWEADYGLAEGERYEPSPLDDDVDLSHPRVMTLLGPVDPGALGMTVFVTNRTELVSAGRIDPTALLAELEVAHAIGLRSLVIDDRESALDQRDHLVWLAERSPVHLILLSEQKFGNDSRSFVWMCWADNENEPLDEAERYCFLQEEAVSGLWEHVSTGRVPVSRLLGGLPWPPDFSNVDTLSAFLHTMPLALMELGFSAMDVRSILVDNPAAALSWSSTNR